MESQPKPPIDLAARGMIADARTLDALYDTLREIGDIPTSTGEVKSADFWITQIEAARQSGSLGGVTSTHNLREVAKGLLAPKPAVESASVPSTMQTDEASVPARTSEHVAAQVEHRLMRRIANIVSFEELYKVLEEYDGSFKQDYKAQHTIIEGIRNGHYTTESITRDAGLRTKVSELLEKEPQK